jgi:hypothetical protein
VPSPPVQPAAPWQQNRSTDPDAPSSRRARALETWPAPPSDAAQSAGGPSFHRVGSRRRSTAPRSSGDLLLELTDLFRGLGADDQRRVLDLVRRLSG